MQLPVYLITTQFKEGVSIKSGAPKKYEIHTADVLIKVTDMEGAVSDQVATMRMPKSAPRGLPRGEYIADIEPYVSQTKDLVFAVRKLEPAPVKPAQKNASA